MTTQETTYTRRIFRYGDKTFPDPGGEYTPEQILTQLKGFFPELGHAKTEEKLLADGTLEITFSKQVTRKGAMLLKVAS
jgi:PRTRC genetic system protein C